MSSAPWNHFLCSGQRKPGSTAQLKTDHLLLAGQSLRSTSLQAAARLGAPGSIGREGQHRPEQPEVPELFPAIIVKRLPYPGTAIPVHPVQQKAWARYNSLLVYSQLISERALWLTKWLWNSCNTDLWGCCPTFVLRGSQMVSHFEGEVTHDRGPARAQKTMCHWWSHLCTCGSAFGYFVNANDT